MIKMTIATSETCHKEIWPLCKQKQAVADDGHEQQLMVVCSSHKHGQQVDEAATTQQRLDLKPISQKEGNQEG